MTLLIEIENLSKRFVLHHRGDAELPVLAKLSLRVESGECVALQGPSGAGKSTVLKCIYGSYRASSGAVRVRHQERMQDMTSATPREVLAVRRDSLSYVSQFLRVIPRVTSERIVAEALLDSGASSAAVDAALADARTLLGRLNISSRLAGLPPATFSGGEQQRVNLARGLIRPRPVLLLDEPTASLDDANRAVVVDLIREARERGAAVIGIFHDSEVRAAVATRILDIAAFKPECQR